MIQLLLIKTTPYFQLLPISKVDQSLLRIHEAPPYTVSEKSKNINSLNVFYCNFNAHVGGIGKMYSIAIVHTHVSVIV